MSPEDDYFTMEEACQNSGLTELEIFERFFTHEIKPSVVFLRRVPAKMVSKGEGQWVNKSVFHLAKGPWDLTIGNKSVLVNGSESLIAARRDALRHGVAVTPNPSGYIFIQRDKRNKGEELQLHKVEFFRLLDEKKLAAGEEFPAIDLPPDAPIVIRKIELLNFLDKQRAGSATGAGTPAEEGAREGTTASDIEQAPKPWKMRVQAEAHRYWLQLRATGANPTVASIRPYLVTWCKNQNVVTDRHVNPSDGYLRTHVLSGKHWNPPETMTPEKAKQLLEQTAQTTQSAVALNVQNIG